MRVWTVLSSALSAVALCAAADQAKTCYVNSDCPAGASCVAGDSVNSVQRCVAGTACSGAMMGNCPSDEASGQLACIWRPDAAACAKTPAGCKEVNSQLGIYKCISITRCDEYYGGSCSAQCNAGGQACNGRGSCQLTGGNDTSPSFGCQCDSGWKGPQCNSVRDGSCQTGVGECGAHGVCTNGKCECKDGYTGEQCEKAPLSPSSAHSGTGPNANTNTNGNGGGVILNSSQSVSTPPTTAKGTIQKDAKAKHTSATLPILIAVLAVVVLVATGVFVVYARKKRQQDEAAAAFQSAESAGCLTAGPPTPKQRIVTM